MKVEVTKVLTDVCFFRDTISNIKFVCNDGRTFIGFPSIAAWTNGNIILSTTDGREIMQRLAGYDINAELVNDDGRPNSGVKFAAKVGDDIISVLHMALTQRAKNKKLSDLTWKLNGLNQNVDQLIEQASHAHRGVFSSGINSVLNQINTLKNNRIANDKQYE